MAFPASGGTIEALSDALNRTRALARAAKLTSVSLRDASAAGPIVARRAVQVMEELSSINDQFNVLKAVPGLGDYAKAQYADANFNIATEFTTMQNALVACVNWITTNIPKDTVSSRWILVEEIVDGKRVDRTLTTVQTAGLRTVLDTLIASIN